MAADRFQLRDQISALLDTLGSDAGQVAASLAIEGVRGKPRSMQDCAIAVYLAPVIGADNRTRSVDVSTAHVRVRLQRGRRFAVRVRLPRPVRQFIFAFDAGMFPSLVRQTVPSPSITPGFTADGIRAR